jgi:hypothetical protein
MGIDRRRHHRLRVRLTGTLELLEAEGGQGSAFGIHLTDVSSAGLGIIAGGPLPVGARVHLQLNGGSLTGFVAHCRPENGHFAAGITVDRDSGVLSSIQWIADLCPAAHPAGNGPTLV